MSRTAIFLFTFLFSCSIQEDVIIHCKDEAGFGALYKDNATFHCPFTLQNKAGSGKWKNLEDGVTILAYDVDDYFPLKQRNAPSMHRVKMNILKKDFTEEQYTVSLWTTDKNYKACGEAREFVFYKVAESADSTEYNTYAVIDGEFPEGSSHECLFFGEREMPSHDWYHVLKVCSGRENGFILMGEIKE